MELSGCHNTFNFLSNMKGFGKFYREYLPFIAAGSAITVGVKAYQKQGSGFENTCMATAVVLTWPASLPILLGCEAYSFATGRDVYAKFRLQMGTREQKD